MTADPRAVEIVADALWRLDGILVTPDGPDEYHRSNAEALLAKFTAAGWSLLPPGGQTHTEWSARKPGDADPWTRPYRTEGELDEKLHSRRNHPLFGGPQEKLTRTVCTTPWQPADTPGAQL